MKLPLICLSFLLFGCFCYSQKCEQLQREYFPFLPKDVPNTVNCIDSLGWKQGWWVLYKVDYRPEMIPDIGPKGNYVAFYRYGKFRDNKKIGKWIDFRNIHLCFEERIDSFYYNKDTAGVYSEFGNGREEKTIRENVQDGSIAYSAIFWDTDTAYIFCDKNAHDRKKACQMIINHKEIKRFPLLDFEIQSAFMADTIAFERDKRK